MKSTGTHISHTRVCPSEYHRIHGGPRNSDLKPPACAQFHRTAQSRKAALAGPGRGPARVRCLGPEAGTSHVARLLGQGVVHWQSELAAAILLPAPPDSGEPAAEAGQQEQAFGQDHDTRHQQREREGGRQVELVMAVFEGTGPAVGECVQGTQQQGHEAQSGLRERGSWS